MEGERNYWQQEAEKLSVELEEKTTASWSWRTTARSLRTTPMASKLGLQRSRWSLLNIGHRDWLVGYHINWLFVTQHPRLQRVDSQKWFVSFDTTRGVIFALRAAVCNFAHRRGTPFWDTFCGFCWARGYTYDKGLQNSMRGPNTALEYMRIDNFFT